MDNYIGKKLDGRYEILELIGSGGMANVYKANDRLENRTVAVKILRDEFLDNEELVRRFKNESKAIGLLSHPNIVKVYDVNFSDQVQYIAMEYIDGITLKTYIDRTKPLPWKDTLHFTVQILKALQHAHDRGIVHRDIKPQNIMLLEDGSIKVMDFGIARFSRSETRTITDKTIGSVHYISPEQAKGDITDAKADIYSVGIMMYEMLTGKLPFDSDSAVSIAIKQISDNAVRPREIVPDIPEALEEITLKAMAKNPSMRYQSASQMLRDIDDFKKNPSIVFAYKYFNEEPDVKKYIDNNSKDKSASTAATAAKKPAAKKQTAAKPCKKGSLSLAILLGVTAACVISTAILLMFAFGLFENEKLDVDLPNFVGKTLTEIQSNDEYKNFDFTIQEEYNNDYPEGTVYDQSPLPPKKVKETGEVTLYVSKGTEIVTIPNIINMTSGDAKTTLRNLGLSVRQESLTDTNYDTNRVVQVSPVVGSEIESGSTVTIYINTIATTSSVRMPNLVGKLHYEARATLSSYGLKIAETISVDSDQPSGTVLAQSIADGTMVSSGMSVTLTVSNGVIKATGIKLDKSSISLDVGNSEKISASVSPSNCTETVKWSSSDPNVATVSDNGTVTAAGSGSCTVTATCGSVSASCTVNVAGSPLPTTYTVTVTVENGTGGGTATVVSGGNATFTVGANEGFVLPSAASDGTAIDAAGVLTISNVTGNTNITVTCTPQG